MPDIPDDKWHRSQLIRPNYWCHHIKQHGPDPCVIINNEAQLRGSQKPGSIGAGWSRGAQQMDMNMFYITSKGTTIKAAVAANWAVTAWLLFLFLSPWLKHTVLLHWLRDLYQSASRSGLIENIPSVWGSSCGWTLSLRQVSFVPRSWTVAQLGRLLALEIKKKGFFGSPDFENKFHK